MARVRQQPWIVRFEDIDTPRVLPGAMDQQLSDLATLGMVPDTIVVQSKLLNRHKDVFSLAVNSGQVYPCTCSRAEVQRALANLASAPHEIEPLYDGTCRATRWDPVQILKRPENRQIAWRFRSPPDSGHQDFIVARTTGGISTVAPSYHFACAIDDYDGNYGLLVRAWDLAPARLIQKAIYDWLSSKEIPRVYPEIFHTSLVTDNDGRRLEKRTKGVTLEELLASGHDVGGLILLFERSFAVVGPLSDGERHQQITLSSLGIVN